MRGRKILGMAVVLLGSSLACGMLGDADQALDGQDAFTDRVCACSDVACVQTVQEEYALWITEHAMDFAAAGASDGERLNASIERMEGCLQRFGEALGDGAGGSDASQPTTATGDAADEVPPKEDGGAGSNPGNAGGPNATSGTAGGQRGKGKRRRKGKR